MFHSSCLFLPSILHWLALCHSFSCQFVTFVFFSFQPAFNLHLSVLVFVSPIMLFLSTLSSQLFRPQIPLSLPSSPSSLTLSVFLCPTQAVNQAGAGPYSEQVSFRTPATNPDPVSSLTLLDLPTSSESGHSPSTCLLLRWDEPNSNGAEITSYVITLDDQSITVESGTSHLVTGLQPDSEYRYWHKLVDSRAQVRSI